MFTSLYTQYKIEVIFCCRTNLIFLIGADHGTEGKITQLSNISCTSQELSLKFVFKWGKICPVSGETVYKRYA